MPLPLLCFRLYWFSGLLVRSFSFWAIWRKPVISIMIDADIGDRAGIVFPSSFRRAIKYGQKDAANEILRTEVLSRLQKEKRGFAW